ncbi:unnamed protein product [Clavelina lepadiformis]|uniref:Protein-PII uridylyltransferase N-terminal domain-containing protein n=1 Tax=Clavelina lepadiformis TaxID=159417 RepID=A0ABP0G3R8_CLALP
MAKEIGGLKEDSFLQTELKLAQDLKQCCDAEGKEINPFMSAPILNEIGLIYRKRSPDKLSLIRSAVLLNAAVSRQPSNANFQNDVKEVCSYLLQVAGAHDQKADLVEFSKKVEIQIQEMRNGAKEKLAQLAEIPYEIPDNEFNKLAENKIEIIEGLENMITEKYKSVMEHVSSKCQNIMGTPPCRFNVTGMGSLARGEITPYSDFEHIILLEEGIQHKSDYKKILEYFRWFSVIFHFIIINLQETIVPSVTVPSLNNNTLPEYNWFYDYFTKRGVSFDGLIFHACKLPLGRTEKTKNKPWTTELIKPVNEMLQYLDFEVALKNGYHLNEVLKETCFVFGDRKLYDDFEHGRFEVQNTDVVLHEFQRTKQLEDDLDNFSMDKLCNVLDASSCNIKRVIYRSVSLFISALGHLYSIKFSSSFNVVRQLQKEGRINGETAIGLRFALAVACEVRLKVYMAKGRQDDCLDKGETLCEWVSDIRMQVMIQKAQCLLYIGKYKEAVEQINRTKREIASTDVDDFFFKPTLYNIAGQAKCELGLFHEALTEFRNYFKCPFDKTKAQSQHQFVDSVIYVGLCLMELGKLDSAMHKARQALELSKQIKSLNILNIYILLSECYFRKEKYKGSLEYAEKALDGVNEIRDSWIAKYFKIEDIEARIKACKEKLGYDNTACA